MTIERARLIATIDCCMVEDGCDLCPLGDELCDDGDGAFVPVPARLLDKIRKELVGKEGRNVQ